MSHVLNFSQAVGLGPDLLGGKGAGLAAMATRGFNVPPGFVVTTDVCRTYQATGVVPDGVRAQIDKHLSELEQVRGRRLGDPDAPLLLAVRSGAPVSMPGMMDTVLDLGVTRATRPALERQFGARFAIDSHRRFLQSFGTIVLGIADEEFEAILSGAHDTDDVEQLEGVVRAFEELIATHCPGVADDPREHLAMAVHAVFRSWNNPRAHTYRELEGICEDLGTAVVVQSMVFGNRNERSGTGVVFTRNPNTGDDTPYGDFLFRAQGEDVVSGRYQTLPVAALGERLPDVWSELNTELHRLEHWLADMLDVEFTVEDGELFLLQVRGAKRAATAAIRVAVDLAREGRIDRATALRRVSRREVETISRPHVDAAAADRALATGLPASPGAATGVVCLSPDDVEDLLTAGEAVILVRSETSPNDIHGMALAEGIVTTRGGLVSHAAVVARGLGIPAVVGAESVVIDDTAGMLRIGDEVVRQGETITIDGGSGVVARGVLPVIQPPRCDELETLLAWADELTGADGDQPAGDRLSAAQKVLDQ